MNPARAKVEAEGVCRACGHAVPEHLDAAHLWDRSMGGSGFEDADLVVPLCSAFKSGSTAPGCHEAYDAHELDLLGCLTVEEEIALVRAAFPPTGRGSGIEQGRRRAAPSAYRGERSRRQLTAEDYGQPGTVFDA